MSSLVTVWPSSDSVTQGCATAHTSGSHSASTNLCQADPALAHKTRDPPALLLAAAGHPLAPRLHHKRQHLRRGRCRCRDYMYPITCCRRAAAIPRRRGDALRRELRADWGETGEILRRGPKMCAVEQRRLGHVEQQAAPNRVVLRGLRRLRAARRRPAQRSRSSLAWRPSATMRSSSAAVQRSMVGRYPARAPLAVCPATVWLLPERRSRAFTQPFSVATFSVQYVSTMGFSGVCRGLAAGPRAESYHPRDPWPRGSRGGATHSAKMNGALTFGNKQLSATPCSQ